MPCIVSIYSVDLRTDRDYLIDHHFKVLRKSRTVLGDGTVSAASAALGTALEKRYEVHGGVKHDNLPCDPRVLEIVTKELGR